MRAWWRRVRGSLPYAVAGFVVTLALIALF